MGAGYTTGFDAHAHLDHLAGEELSAAVSAARRAGVTGWALASSDPSRWAHLKTIAGHIGGVAQLGLHPWWAQEMDPGDQDVILAALAREELQHGLGETGLDRHRARSERARQRQLRAFQAQIALATRRDVPLILHGTRAWGSVLDTLPRRIEGVLHAFTGSPEVARRAVAQGLHLSFGHRILQSERAQQALLKVPDERLLLETDAPDGCPAEDLIRIARFAASLRGQDPDRLLAVTSTNARRLFRVPKELHGPPLDTERP